MTIAEYYKCYESKKGCKTIQYPIKLIDGTAKTVGELYDVCINEHVEKIQNNALKWHQMLMRYVEREDAIFWIRRYESSSKKAKADNRILFIIVMNFRYSNISKNSLFPSISKRDIAH